MGYRKSDGKSRSCSQKGTVDAGYEAQDEYTGIFTDLKRWDQLLKQDSYGAELKLLAKNLVEEEDRDEYNDLYGLCTTKKKTDLRERNRVSEMTTKNEHKKAIRDFEPVATSTPLRKPHELVVQKEDKIPVNDGNSAKGGDKDDHGVIVWVDPGNHALRNISLYSSSDEE